MDPTDHHGLGQQGVALTSFDAHTADAVVTVLSRAGIGAWQHPSPEDPDEVLVLVADGQRDRAMQEMGRRMDEIAGEVGRDRPARRGGGDVDRPRRLASDRGGDDLHEGPPLTMQRFADLRVVVAVVIGPLLAVTIAGPFLPRSLRVIGFAVIALGLAVLVWRRRR